MLNYARIRFIDRPAPQAIYYATEGFQQMPKGDGKGDQYPIPTKWALEEKRLQTAQAWEQQYKEHVWLVNTTGKCEYITTAGNVVSYEVIIQNHLAVRTFALNEDPRGVMGIENMTYLTQPDLFHKVTAMSHDGRVYNPGPNLNMYHILTTNGHVWMDENGITRAPQAFMSFSQVELFPPLPYLAKVNLSTVPWLNIRSTPSTLAAKVGQYLPGSPVTILQYRPQGSDVWGRTDRGWICLQKYLTFYTSWRMTTPPPIPE